MRVKVSVEHGGRGRGDHGAAVAAAGGDGGLSAVEGKHRSVRVEAVGVAAGVAAGEDYVQGLERDVEDARGVLLAAEEGEKHVEAAEVDEALRLVCVRQRLV